MKLLDKWMEEYEQKRLQQLMRTKELMMKWFTEKKEQKTLIAKGHKYDSFNEKTDVYIPEMKCCCDFNISPRWERVIEKTAVFDREQHKYVAKDVAIIIDNIEVEGKLYKDYVHGGNYFENKKKYNGLAALLKFNGLSMSDEEWLENGRNDEEIRTRAHKDMLAQKKAIEEKVRKICGEEITHVDEYACDIYCKGSNGKVAHLWAITAGGYNIQCLHIRVLVKEDKNYEKFN